MKCLVSVLLALLLAAPFPALAEIILFEDENGKVILEDDGGVSFLPPGQTAESAQESAYPEETFSPVSVSAVTSTPQPDKPAPMHPPEKMLQYGDNGDHVFAAQEQLTLLGYYHGECSGNYLEGTQSAVRRFQQRNGIRESGKLDLPTWIILFSEAAIARDGSSPWATPSPVPSPTPVPTAAPFVYKKSLSYGDSGDLVSALQRRLLELGFYSARVSGGYYEITQKAVLAFQTHNGLHADGIAGKQTQELLFSDHARASIAAPLPSPTPVPPRYKLMVDVANQITRAYTYDENGEYTVLVREMICSTGTSRNPTPLGTTIMPKKRARWGYFPTWDSHAQYLTRIDSANAFHSVLYYAADENTLSVESFEKLGTPASHGCVRLYVSDAKWIYDNCAEGTIITVYEGEYDPEYTMTLRRSLNADTLRERSLPAPTSRPVYHRENWPTQYRTLHRGRSGEDVYMLQMRLKELGYYPGTVTGGYYGGTIQAVEAFQRDYGLSVDGVAGEKTQAVLFSAQCDPSPAPTMQPTRSPSPSPEPSPTAAASPAPSLSPAPTVFVPLPGSVG